MPPQTPHSPRTPPAILVLAAIQQWYAAHPYPPTLRELADIAGYSYASSICRHLEILHAWGFIEYIPNRARTITLTPAGRDYRPR